MSTDNWLTLCSITTLLLVVYNGVNSFHSSTHTHSGIIYLICDFVFSSLFLLLSLYLKFLFVGAVRKRASTMRVSCHFILLTRVRMSVCLPFFLFCLCHLMNTTNYKRHCSRAIFLLVWARMGFNRENTCESDIPQSNPFAKHSESTDKFP